MLRSAGPAEQATYIPVEPTRHIGQFGNRQSITFAFDPRAIVAVARHEASAFSKSSEGGA